MAEYKNPFANKTNGTNTGADEAISWDTKIEWEDPPEYVILPPGNYEFTVTNWERGHYNGNPTTGKIACETAIVTVAVDTPQGKATARNTFYMKKSALGFIRQFFLCIGLLKKGESFTPNWDNAIGCKGMAEFSNREGSNGKTYNDVKKWIRP